MPESGKLSDVDLAILDFAALRWQRAGAREQAIHDRFSWSAVRYAQRLNALLDDPAAYRAQPVLCKRLRRVREARQADRGRRLAG